jgi:hypothetical protein
MVKIALLKQYIPGRTFDYFRPEGYDIVAIIDVDAPPTITPDMFRAFLESFGRKPAKEHDK